MLRDQWILITGASGGIGKAIAGAVAAQGAHTLLVSRSVDALEQVAQKIRAESGCQSIPIPTDLSNFRAIDDLFEKMDTITPKLDAFIAAAAGVGPMGPVDEVSMDSWRETILVNLVGSAACTQAASQRMKNTDGGRIILFSGAGEGPQPLLSAYAASKGGVTRFAESIAPELAPYGIFVNAIAPGPVKTQMLNDILNLGPTSLGEARYRRLLEQSARNSPENAIRLCNFLLSPRSRGLYGKTISAQWDEYESWVNLTEISEGSLYTMKRFTPQ